MDLRSCLLTHMRDLLAIAKFLVEHNMSILFVGKNEHVYYFTGMRVTVVHCFRVEMMSRQQWQRAHETTELPPSE